MQTNPFDITKADDFSNDDIARLWVDLPVGARIADILEPTSPMPLLVIGGKGSGKTHLMRHASYPLQKLSAQRHLTNVTADGYLGIYFRCSGLNTGRFAGKGQTTEKWQTVFEYFMELWIGQKVLEVVADVLTFMPDCVDAQLAFMRALAIELDSEVAGTSIADFLSFVRSEQRKVNHAVNNCALSEKLEVEVKLTRGSLIFGIPRLAGSTIGGLHHTRFLYLVDELEHLLEPHQRYLQTLMRERQYPATFRVGARRYGVSTYETYSAGETNKRGSEFDEIDLDERMRESSEYPDFARQLAVSRIRDAGVAIAPEATAEREFLSRLFPTPTRDLLARNETDFVRRTWKDRERPYFAKLREELRRYTAASADEITEIVTLLRCPEYPLLEKTNVFLLYRAWNKGVSDLAKTARQLANETARILAGERDAEQVHILKHWKSDLLAQLYRDCRRPVRYTGFDNFVTMSSGYPRNILVILKNTIRYAAFAEASTLTEPIPSRLQDSAVRISAEWFFHDAGIATPEAESIRAAVSRLATLMRSIRYSDLPAECSLSTFGVDRSAVTATTRSIIERCVTWSLLIEIPRGHKDKNTEDIFSKYQVNPMIAPKWELPLSRRGALELQPSLANAVFDPDHAGSFEKLLDERVAGLNVPFGRITRRSEQQIQLSGLHD